MGDKTVDMPVEIGYYSDNENMIVVKMDEQAPINDVNCRHEVLVADLEDTIGEAIYHGCANLKCGRGFYLQNKNLT